MKKGGINPFFFTKVKSLNGSRIMRSPHIVRPIPTALTGFPNLTGFLNEFESLIVN